MNGDRGKSPLADQMSARRWSLPGYVGPDGLILTEGSIARPAANEILVEVEAVGLNPLDLKLMAGTLQEFMPVQFPFIPASDVCGRVIAVGDAVKAFAPGARLVGMTPSQGAMASHVTFAPGPSITHAPEGLDPFDLAALPEVGLTALQILRSAAPSAKTVIAIVGASGGIGSIACQLCSKADAHVIATGLPSEKEFLQRNGVHEIINYKTTDVFDALRNRRQGRPDVLIDLVNEGTPLHASARALSPSGKLISTLVGPPPEEFEDVVVDYIRLSPQPGDMDHLVELLQSGALRPNVSRVFAFEQAKEAYLALRDEHARGKTIVRVR